MQHAIQYSFQNTNIHAVIINSEVHFRANELALTLGYKNPRQALASHVEKEDVQKLDTLTQGGKQKVLYVNESGMYALIFGSEKAEAKRFKKWVTSEVLPSIRKTGSYSLTLNTEQQYAIKEAVIQNTRLTGRTYQAVYRDLYNEFKVPKYQDILAKDFQSALNFLRTSKANPPAIPNIKEDGRWLVIVENNRVSEVKNMHGFSFVSAIAYEKLKQQTRQQAEYLVELAKRMRIVGGNEDIARLDLPIEQSHPKFIS